MRYCSTLTGRSGIRYCHRFGCFSEIGGETVPHTQVEEAIRGVLGPEGERAQIVVTAVPDEKKGERPNRPLARLRERVRVRVASQRPLLVSHLACLRV